MDLKPRIVIGNSETQALREMAVREPDEPIELLVDDLGYIHARFASYPGVGSVNLSEPTVSTLSQKLGVHKHQIQHEVRTAAKKAALEAATPKPVEKVEDVDDGE